MLGACSTSVPTPDSPMPDPTPSPAEIDRGSPAPTSPSPVATPEPRLAYTCGTTPPFAPALLAVEAGAESSSDPAADALRRLVAEESANAPAGASLFPEHGWWRVARTDTQAAFLAESERSELGYVSATFARAGDAWEPVQWGECAPQVALPAGLGPATWRIDGESPDPDSREVRALVTELSCASGASSDGRILEPEISYQAEAIVVTFAVRTQSGPQTCQGNPAVAYRILLSERVGDRVLYDGGELPLRDASTCDRPERGC